MVADGELENYESEIEKLGVGCSISVAGKLVASQGKGQDREIHAIKIEVLGWVDDPESIQSPKKNTRLNF